MFLTKYLGVTFRDTIARIIVRVTTQFIVCEELPLQNVQGSALHSTAMHTLGRIPRFSAQQSRFTKPIVAPEDHLVILRPVLGKTALASRLA